MLPKIHSLFGLALQFVERLARKDIRLGVGKLLLHNLRIGSAFHKLASQRMRIGMPGDNALALAVSFGRTTPYKYAHQYRRQPWPS